MPCTKEVLNFKWQHHHWRPEVTHAEIVTVQEPDMWARTVERDYVRCEKQEVCDECGAVRNQVSCLCDMTKGERCQIRLDYLSQEQKAG